MKTWTAIVVYMVLGAIVFWTPAIAIEAWIRWRRPELEISLACPAVLLVFYALLHRVQKTDDEGPSAPLFTLLGIWVFAPWLMMIAATVSGGEGFRFMRGSEYWWLIISSLVPPITLYVSAMQGTGYALVGATILLLYIHYRFERGRWMIPPQFRRGAQFRSRTDK